MVASREHPELYVEKKKMLKKVWSYPFRPQKRVILHTLPRTGDAYARCTSVRADKKSLGEQWTVWK